MKVLGLGIFEGMTTQKEIIETAAKEFECDISELKKYKFLIAYVDYGSYEGTGFLLMRDKETGKLFENHSGHCSCFGNEDQFEPEPTDVIYLKSDKFSCYCYGDEDALIKKQISKI